MTRMRTAWRRTAQDHGSIPLVMLAGIVAGGLVVVIVASTISSERSVRFDRDFTQVVHVADAGVQDAVVKLNNEGLEPAPYSQTLDGVVYEVTPVEQPDDSWQVTSTAEINGVRRTVVADVSEVPLFGFALFARNGVSFNGANFTDSYNPATGEWCTGRGIVGSDGILHFNGLAPANSCHGKTTNARVTVDAAVLYDCGEADAKACRTAKINNELRCEHKSSGDNCKTKDEVSRGPLHAFPDPFRITPEAEVEKIVEETAQCEVAGWSDTHPTGSPGVKSSTGGVWATGNGDVIQHRPASSGRDFYCIRSLQFGGDTQVKRGPDGEPVRIYVKDGTIETVGTSTKVNCPGCTHSNYQATTPDASALQIISTGASTFKLASPQIQFAGAVYAPNAACDGPAGPDVFGSLICGKVANVGGWKFHYDDSLQDQGGTGLYAVAQYREEANEAS